MSDSSPYPIPDEAVDAVCRSAHPLWPAYRDDVKRKVRAGIRSDLEAAAPALYRQWAESMVEPVAEALYDTAVVTVLRVKPDRRIATPWHEVDPETRADWLRAAQGALGLDDGGED